MPGKLHTLMALYPGNIKTFLIQSQWVDLLRFSYFTHFLKTDNLWAGEAIIQKHTSLKLNHFIMCCAANNSSQSSMRTILQMQYLTLKPLMAISDNGNCPVCDVLSPSHLCGSVVLRVDLKMSCVLQIQQGTMGKSEHVVFICHFPPEENILSTIVNLISLQSSILHPHEVLW